MRRTVKLRRLKITFEPLIWFLPIALVIDRDYIAIGILCIQFEYDTFNYKKALKKV